MINNNYDTKSLKIKKIINNNNNNNNNFLSGTSQSSILWPTHIASAGQLAGQLPEKQDQ